MWRFEIQSVTALAVRFVSIRTNLNSRRRLKASLMFPVHALKHVQGKTCTHTYAHTHIHTRTHTHKHKCAHKQTHTQTHIHTHIRTHTHTHTETVCRVSCNGCMDVKCDKSHSHDRLLRSPLTTASNAQFTIRARTSFPAANPSRATKTRPTSTQFPVCVCVCVCVCVYVCLCVCTRIAVVRAFGP